MHTFGHWGKNASILSFFTDTVYVLEEMDLHLIGAIKSSWNELSDTVYKQLRKAPMNIICPVLFSLPSAWQLL